MSIQDDAYDGSLNPSRLKKYIAIDKSTINRIGGKYDVTPLAAACWAGHLDVVRCLLDYGADANAESPFKRTPLYFATTRSPPTNRAAIVQALIDPRAGANVNLACDDDGNTPLMMAISQTKDKEVIHILVDKGAAKDANNLRGQTVEGLAKKHKMVRHLRPADERNSKGKQVIELVVSLVQLIIAVTNSSIVSSVVGGIAKKLYNISGERNPKLENELSNPTSVADFQNHLNNYVKKNDLEKFFARNDPFLQRLAAKANALRDSDPVLGSPENINRLIRLSLYRPIIYCDDSDSMEGENRWNIQRELVMRIATVASKIVPDDVAGVGLMFINSPSSSTVKADKIEEAYNAVRPNGGTKIGGGLRNKILEPVVYKALIPNSPTPFKRPVLVCVITDGCPSEPMDTFENAILECRQKLEDANYEATAVRFCISQIGTDRSATEFINGLRNQPRIQTVLHCTSGQLDAKFNELKENEKGLELWLLETLTSPIMHRD